MSSDYAAFLQAVVGTILVFAAAAKMGQRDSLRPFLLAVGFSWRTSNLASRVAPSLEGLVGASLLTGVAFPAAVAATVLAFMFCSVLLLARGRGVDEGCRCFGFLDSSKLSLLPVIRAGVLTGVAFLLSLIYLDDGMTAWIGLRQGSAIVLTVLGVFVGIGYIGVFALLEQVRSFERRRPHRVPAPKARVL